MKEQAQPDRVWLRIGRSGHRDALGRCPGHRQGDCESTDDKTQRDRRAADHRASPGKTEKAHDRRFFKRNGPRHRPGWPEVPRNDPPEWTTQTAKKGFSARGEFLRAVLFGRSPWGRTIDVR